MFPIKATEFIQWLFTLNYRPEPLPPPEEFVDPPWPVPTPELAPPAAPALDLGPEPAAGGGVLQCDAFFCSAQVHLIDLV